MTFNQQNYKKITLICLALLTFSGAMIKMASAQSCSVNCLRVYNITLTDRSTYIDGIVKLTDETYSGAAPRGSVVQAVWTRPDGSTFDQYANIGTRLRANFRVNTASTPGTYTLNVVDATKADYTFDQANSSILSKNITIGNSSNQPPNAVFNTDVISGSIPLTVNFDSSDSVDPDGMIVDYVWDFGNGSSSTEANPSHTYTDIGNFIISLTVRDDMGATSTTSTSITVADSNAGCISNCMSVDRIALSYKEKSGKIKGRVWVVDEKTNGVKDALVHATWTLPDGSTIDQYKKVGSRLRATFALKANAAGIYKLTLVEVIKAGYSFDPDSSNMLTGIIDIAH